MPKFNDINIKDWKKESDIWTDSLWIIPERDKSGKHSGFYHGNFVPQIPNQLIRRYTKKGETILDPFVGSGTTAFECQALERNFIGIDIQPQMVDYIQNNVVQTDSLFCETIIGDSTQQNTFNEVSCILENRGKKKVQFVILHPPYFDIIKFCDNKNDLSNAVTLNDFLVRFADVVKNAISILEKNRYLALVIGDKYANGTWMPLGFYCMYAIQKLGISLKSIIVKNMEGNRAKQGMQALWRYRALSSDYYIFKHEYIFIFKNTIK